MSTPDGAPWPALLGYLNLSEGRPDPRFQKGLNEAYGEAASLDPSRPWRALQTRLEAELDALIAAGSAAVRDSTQVRAVLTLTFDHLLPGYREHHRDLLFHLDESDLFVPFFLARAFEAVLIQGQPWHEIERIVSGALAGLNDFAGHRPIAILESRPRAEPYDHERVRPIPLYVRGAGVAAGQYHDLVSQALEILREADAGLLADAHFDLEQLDEWAVDPRAYDHTHPANRRPNYVFGEWDPDHIDGEGRYRRFVGRLVVLDALLEWTKNGPSERLFEAAAVLAGTTLMAAGISGWGPSAHGAEATLALRMPPVARCRDAFYEQRLERARRSAFRRSGEPPEGGTTNTQASQPFAGVRQHLNQFLARDRAFQHQQRRLAVLFARMSYPDAARQEATRIPTASVRFLTEVHARLASSERRLAEKNLRACASELAGIEDLIRRGIDCGALVDPWNVLGFQGQFPLAAAREDSVRDPRIDELLAVMADLFDRYSRLLAETAALGDGLGDDLGDGLGDSDTLQPLKKRMRALADWWDRFATTEVSDLRRVHGGELAESAEQVATALGRWHAGGEAAGDLAFWRRFVDDFRTPAAFARVIEALLERGDLRAAMALLMAWLSQAEQVPLDDGERSFHELAYRWLDAATRATSPQSSALVTRFFDLLEANAGELWETPVHEAGFESDGQEDKSDDLFEAAYEGVTFRDSAEDGGAGEIVDDGPPGLDFPLEHVAEELLRRLRFRFTIARLWHTAVPATGRSASRLGDDWATNGLQSLATWLRQARRNHDELLILLESVQNQAVPPSLGSHESLVEYDRRLGLKTTVLEATIGTSLETLAAIRALSQATGETEEGPASPWEPPLQRLGRALDAGQADAARAELAACLQLLRNEAIVFMPLVEGGSPLSALRAQSVLQVLHELARTLPRYGLVREALDLLHSARGMERNHAGTQRRVSEFSRLFDSAFQATVETIIHLADRDAVPAAETIEFLEQVTEPFLKLWIEHSRTLRLSELELLSSESEWEEVRRFIRRYGRDLFHARFMTLANLRGILHGGIAAYLDGLKDNADPLHPMELAEELDRKIPREQAARRLEFILRALIENYDDYRDYNTTCPHSDYGDNLHILLEFLRLKAAYRRQAWHFRPLFQVHELLCRAGPTQPAARWEEGFEEITRALADQFERELQTVEHKTGARLAGVAELLAERFVKPLSFARLAARVAPAMRQASASGPTPAFVALLEELRPFAGHAMGAGLGTPEWLRRMEAEVERVRSRTDDEQRETDSAPNSLHWQQLREPWRRDAKP